MKQPLDEQALDQLFRSARTYPSWQDRPVSDEQLQALYELLKWGPTSMNCMPARFVFLRTAEAKARLEPALMAANLDKVRAAPVTVIVAHDDRFFEHLPTLWPHTAGAREMFADNAALAETTAFRNATLQGAYLIMAARALGLDVGPMSGFDNAKVDAEFFPDGGFRSNFLANLGYGDPTGLFPRGPRLDFAQAVTLL
ncbi:nitroreductase [Thioflavicoccus mobilis 8321]|uniref:Putative NADH dehydrogenase/NAD(P)H nitroreductase Thimo_1885 n=1 Tax=Thioflavicoccus mobilis 8321 TaxID=765912 RepID=L0GXD6_9GAMM|nr:malonic semialdehyde reductase [Thioflavicoccus mobilis]AGA90651.1 nitroreductase [Thioflavicoccus mobilis 8321]